MGEHNSKINITLKNVIITFTDFHNKHTDLLYHIFRSYESILQFHTVFGTNQIKKEDSFKSSILLKPATLAMLAPMVGFLPSESSRRCPVSYVPLELKKRAIS